MDLASQETDSSAVITPVVTNMRRPICVRFPLLFGGRGRGWNSRLPAVVAAPACMPVAVAHSRPRRHTSQQDGPHLIAFPLRRQHLRSFGRPMQYIYY